jgi:hypothetical protein
MEFSFFNGKRIMPLLHGSYSVAVLPMGSLKCLFFWFGSTYTVKLNLCIPVLLM